jgi:hypothetical protein
MTALQSTRPLHMQQSRRLGGCGVPVWMAGKMLARSLPMLAALVALFTSSEAFAQNLVTPLAQSTPRLRFHLGQAVNNAPVISPVLPDMPYTVSSYYVSQWNQSSYIKPTLLETDDRATFDNQYGVARYAFESEDGHAHVWVYPDDKSSWVYELYETGGTLRGGGGSNIFLANDHLIAGTFGRPISLDFDAKISKAALFGSINAQQSGAVVSQAFTGLGYLFIDPQTHNQQFVFLQIPITVSGGPVRRAAKSFCSGTSISLFQPSLVNNEKILPYISDTGPLHHFHYALTSYLKDLVASTACGQTWPASASNPNNWSLTAFYMGLETETADDRNAQNNPPEGYLETGLQVANLVLVRE